MFVHYCKSNDYLKIMIIQLRFSNVNKFTTLIDICIALSCPVQRMRDIRDKSIIKWLVQSLVYFKNNENSSRIPRCSRLALYMIIFFQRIDTDHVRTGKRFFAVLVTLTIWWLPLLYNETYRLTIILSKYFYLYGSQLKWNKVNVELS